jgi:hypothetical protein
MCDETRLAVIWAIDLSRSKRAYRLSTEREHVVHGKHSID